MRDWIVGCIYMIYWRLNLHWDSTIYFTEHIYNFVQTLVWHLKLHMWHNRNLCLELEVWNVESVRKLRTLQHYQPYIITHNTHWTLNLKVYWSSKLWFDVLSLLLDFFCGDVPFGVQLFVYVSILIRTEGLCAAARRQLIEINSKAVDAAQALMPLHCHYLYLFCLKHATLYLNVFLFFIINV